MDTESKIIDSDIKYKDELVTILHPHIQKGVLIVYFYNAEDREQIVRDGIKTGEQLQKEGYGIEKSKNIIHPYIFFRSPFNKFLKENKLETYKNVHSELKNSFGNLLILEGDETKYMKFATNNFVCIRVDPENTKVFSSEIITQQFYDIKKSFESKYKKSGKTLSNYLDIITENSKRKNTYETHDIFYNLLTSKKFVVEKTSKMSLSLTYPYNKYPIERNSEILVKLPILTPEFFVKI